MSIFDKPNSKNIFQYVLYFIFILFLFLTFGHLLIVRTQEKFDNFAPYNNPASEKAKVVDQILLDSRLKEYERINSCSGGYINIGLPPSNPIFSYPTLSFHPYVTPEEEKKVVYGDPFHKNYAVGIMAGV